MKKNLLLLFAATFVLASCSDDDTATTTPPTAGLTLAKTITYYPLESNYSSKRVMYYNAEGKFTADTLFNSLGNMMERSAMVYTATSATQTGFDASGNITYTNTKTFDAQGRITGTALTNSFGTTAAQFTYNTNGSISYSNANENPQTPIVTYFTNNDGLITSLEFTEDQDTSHIIFDGAAPSKQMYFSNALNTEQVFASFTYFNVEKPANLQLSVTERNNRILPQNQLNAVADTYSFYVKSYENIWEFDRTFNADNYQTYSKQTQFTDNGADTTSETFYYYN